MADRGNRFAFVHAVAADMVGEGNRHRAAAKIRLPVRSAKSKAIQDVSLVCLEWNRGTTTERISCTPHPLVGCRSLGRHRHGVDCRRHRLPFASAIRVCLSHQGAKQERGSVLATLPHGFCNTGPLVVVCGNADTVCNALI